LLDAVGDIHDVDAWGTIFVRYKCDLLPIRAEAGAGLGGMLEVKICMGLPTGPVSGEKD
jgi:hypothetical protein